MRIVLIRGIFGLRVPVILERYAKTIEFIAPESAFREAAEKLPQICRHRRIPLLPSQSKYEALTLLVEEVEFGSYLPLEELARQRLARRDENDWPVLATALAFDCPIWTEDQDFFGCGVATWTTDRIEIFLKR